MIRQIPLALHLLCLALLGTLQAGCRWPNAEESPEIVSSLRFSPSAFDSFSRNTEIRYTLKAPVRVSAVITRRDAQGGEAVVKWLFVELAESKGSHAHTWLGDNDQGRFAPAGEYRGVVLVGGQRFETTVGVFHF